MRIHRIGQTKEVKIRRFIVKVSSSFLAVNPHYHIKTYNWFYVRNQKMLLLSINC